MESKIQPSPELVIGLVGAVGVNLSEVFTALRNALLCVGYKCDVIRLSETMRAIPLPPWADLPKREDVPYDDYLNQYMTAGNDLRSAFGNSVMAWLGMSAIREWRKQQSGDSNQPQARVAYILHSLKHPSEVEALRKVYGSAFILIAAHAPRAHRREALGREIARSHQANKADEFRPQTEALMRRDEAESGAFGQDVRDTFPLADIIVDARNSDVLKRSASRCVEILFGDPYHTPTREEQGMFLAQMAACSSASMARQVGAAICREDGSVVSIGANEVAKFLGGQYWEGDDPDGRDFKRGTDSSDEMRRNILGDILLRLREAGWLSKYSAEPINRLVKMAVSEGETPIMKGALFQQTIDFVRAVHAEMAAIAAAAAHGVSTAGATMYTSTFPCHDCAKHIVASGIKRVVYLEPYAKSLVEELYPDSIIVDPGGETRKVCFDPLVGVAPRRYMELFGQGRRARKNTDGKVVVWDRSRASPWLPGQVMSTAEQLVAEKAVCTDLQAALEIAKSSDPSGN